MSYINYRYEVGGSHSSKQGFVFHCGKVLQVQLYWHLAIVWWLIYSKLYKWTRKTNIKQPEFP